MIVPTIALGPLGHGVNHAGAEKVLCSWRAADVHVYMSGDDEVTALVRASKMKHNVRNLPEFDVHNR